MTELLKFIKMYFSKLNYIVPKTYARLNNISTNLFLNILRKTQIKIYYIQ